MHTKTVLIPREKNLIKATFFSLEWYYKYKNESIGIGLNLEM